MVQHPPTATRSLRVLLLFIAALMLAACGGGSGGGGGSGSEDIPNLVSISLSPERVLVFDGSPILVTVTAHMDDGTTLNTTNLGPDAVDWSVSGPGDAVVEPLAQGTARVSISDGELSSPETDDELTATFTFRGRERSDSVPVTVVAGELDALQVQPSVFDLPQGFSKALTARAYSTDGSVHDVTDLATWRSVDDAIASVGAADLGAVWVTREGEGSMTLIRASWNGRQATSRVTDADLGLDVGALTIEPAEITVPAGTSRQLRAFQKNNGTMEEVTSDGTVTWCSNDKDMVALLDRDGKIAAEPGEAGLITVTVTTGDCPGDDASKAIVRVVNTVLDGPVGVAARATPNMLQSNEGGSDISAQVLRRGNLPYDSPVDVTFSIEDGDDGTGASLDPVTVTTSGDGLAATDLTSGANLDFDPGRVTLRTYVDDATECTAVQGNNCAAGITDLVIVEVVNEFVDMLQPIGRVIGPCPGDDGGCPEGTLFELFLHNKSNRRFAIDSKDISLLNGDGEVDLDVNNIEGAGVIEGGSSARIRIELSSEEEDKGFVARVGLTLADEDPDGHSPFFLEHEFTDPDPDP